jgi:hypothetical protein
MQSFYPRRPSDDHAHERVVVFDIETIVDEEPSDGSFPPWPRHKPVAAAFLSAATSDGETEFRLDTLVCEEGAEAAFYRQVDRLLPAGATAVTFNGRAFDNLVLRLGAMAAFEFAAPNIARLAHANRYGREHADLCELLGGYGAGRGHPLVAICERLRIPVKTSASGGDVGALWRAGERETVLRYVSEDVLATYLVWLNWIAFRHSDPVLIARPLADLARWIERSPELQHLLVFASCPAARWARPRAIAEKVRRALVEAERRVERERIEREFEGNPF